MGYSSESIQSGGLVNFAAQRPSRIYVTLSHENTGYILNHVPGIVERQVATFGADSMTLGCTTVSYEALEAMYLAMQKRKELK